MDNLGTLEVTLPDQAVQRLEDITGFTLGFPGDFIAECETSAWMFGEAAGRLGGR